MSGNTDETYITAGNLDSLTETYTRKGFYQAARKLIDDNIQTEFVIIYWNIKRFKIANNLFGREAGDFILKRVADTLKREFGYDMAVYGRFERDNFACCVPKPAVDAGQWKHLLDIVYCIQGFEYHFYLCCGLYRIQDRTTDISIMCDKARVAMENIKDNYVTPYSWYEDKMWDNLMEEHNIINDFSEAISQRQFKVYYQPLCQAQDGKVISAEALVRWQKNSGEIVSPGKFIPVFEKNGMIGILDRYVWESVCQMISNRIKAHNRVVPVSINVSRVEFYNKNLCRDIYNLVMKYNVPPEYIRIEITESAYSDNPKQVLEAVNKLHEYGFMILMDDFGSGYSSLNILKDLPIDVLKIDMKFFDGFEESKKSAIIIEAVIRMAKWMELKAVAEGVETRQEWEYLKSVECDIVQGFYFYKPMAENAFLELLDKNVCDIDFYDDLGADSLKSDILSQAGSWESMLFYTMIGGMGVIEIKDDNLEIVQVNRGFYEVLYGSDYDEKIIKDGSGEVLNKYIRGQQKETLINYCMKAKNEKELQQFELHYQRNDGKYVWLSVKVRYFGRHGKRLLFYFAIDNIDDIKMQEQERYLFNYSAALLKVYDRVYCLNYDDGTAEVLHTRGNDSMRVGDKREFFVFFDKYADYIEWVDGEDMAEVVKNKKLLDKKLEKSRDGNYCATYRVVNAGENVKVKEVTILFFKVELKRGKNEYICCVKCRYD